PLVFCCVWLASFLSLFYARFAAPTYYPAPSLPDALPISRAREISLRRRGEVLDSRRHVRHLRARRAGLCLSSPGHGRARLRGDGDRQSTRLNSRHVIISYAVVCLKKEKHDSHTRSLVAQI